MSIESAKVSGADVEGLRMESVCDRWCALFLGFVLWNAVVGAVDELFVFAAFDSVGDELELIGDGL